MQKKRPKRRTGYVINTSTSKALDATPLRAVAPADTVKEAGTIKAQLIGKHGSRGYGRLLAGMRDLAVEEAIPEEVAA